MKNNQTDYSLTAHFIAFISAPLFLILIFKLIALIENPTELYKHTDADILILFYVYMIFTPQIILIDAISRNTKFNKLWHYIIIGFLISSLTNLLLLIVSILTYQENFSLEAITAETLIYSLYFIMPSTAMAAIFYIVRNIQKTYPQQIITLLVPSIAAALIIIPMSVILVNANLLQHYPFFSTDLIVNIILYTNIIGIPAHLAIEKFTKATTTHYLLIGAAIPLTTMPPITLLSNNPPPKADIIAAIIFCTICGGLIATLFKLIITQSRNEMKQCNPQGIK